MLRAFLLSIGLSVIATSALAATDIETCRDNQADAAARLTACNAAIADDKVTGKPKAFAHWYIGDSLSKKRDYNGAIVAFNKALEIDPENVTVLNSRGIAYGNKGDDERALADYDSCLKLRPNFGSAHNNRGIIFMRKGDFEQAYNEFSDAIRLNAPQNRFINLYNRGRVQTLRKTIRFGAGRLCAGPPNQCRRRASPGVSLHHLYGDGQIRRSACRLQRGAREVSQGGLHTGEPRQSLSCQRRSRRRAQGLQ